MDCREIQKKRIALIVSIQLTLNPFCIAESPAYSAKRGAQTHPSDETARPRRGMISCYCCLGNLNLRVERTDEENDGLTWGAFEEKNGRDMTLQT